MLFLAQKALQLKECSKPGGCCCVLILIYMLPQPLLATARGGMWNQTFLGGAWHHCCVPMPAFPLPWLGDSFLLLRYLEQLQLLGAEGGFTSPAAGFPFLSHSNSSLKGGLLIRLPLVGIAQLQILIFEVLNLHFLYYRKLCMNLSSAWDLWVPVDLTGRVVLTCWEILALSMKPLGKTFRSFQSNM